MESNHHVPLGTQGPQPCASTSSATAARGATILDVWGLRGRFRLRASGGGGTACEQVFERFDTRAELRRGARRGAGSDQEAEGDLRLHPPLRGQDRLPADGAGDRQSGRPALVLDRARAPRQPGEDRAAATRSLEAAGDRAALRQGEADDPARAAGCRWSARSPPASRSSPKRTSRNTSRSPT